MKKIILFLLACIFSRNTFAQTYNLAPINQLLNDSSALYLNRIYVEVFENNTSIYQFQKGWLNCNNVRLGQGSATKWISGAIMLRLAEKGWWNLDDSIGKYLPIFSMYGKGHITLRQSYSMSTGMVNTGTQAQQYHTNSTLTLAQSTDSIAKNVQIIYPTASMIGYDGSMMHVWGRAAEIVDVAKGGNRDWRTIAKEEFFDLMQMDSTDYTDFYPNNPAVAGGIETTPCDYLKFLKMLSNSGTYNSSTILQPSSIDEMFKDQTNSAPIYYSYWPNNHQDFPLGLDTIRYTLGGWWTEKDASGKIIGITSPGVYGHYPFYDRCRNIYGTFFCYVPVSQGGGKLVMNTYLRFMKILRDTISPTCNLTIGINEFDMDNSRVLVYPNPSSGKITINTGDQMLVRAGLFNSQLSFVKNFNTKDLDISNMAKGMYFLTIETDKLKVTKKIIIN